jgi:hypothetical protein
MAIETRKIVKSIVELRQLVDSFVIEHGKSPDFCMERIINRKTNPVQLGVDCVASKMIENELRLIRLIVFINIEWIDFTEFWICERIGSNKYNFNDALQDWIVYQDPIPQAPKISEASS